MSSQFSPLAPSRVSSDSAATHSLEAVASEAVVVAPEIAADGAGRGASCANAVLATPGPDANAPVVVASPADDGDRSSSDVSLAMAASSRRVGRGSAWQASVPAVLLFALGVAAQHAPLTRPLPAIEVENVSRVVAAGVVAPGDTLVVSAKRVSGSSLLRGRLEFAGGISGRAPLTGEVARVLVREGQFVQVNDRVLQISTSSGSRVVSRVENVQSSAESAQVQAVDAQAALQNKLAASQARLVAARERVARAGVRVGQARDIVQKLQRGENVVIPDADKQDDADDQNQGAARIGSRRARRQDARAIRNKREASANHDAGASRKSNASRDALNDAIREAQSARRAADAAQADVESARRAAEETDKAAGTKTQQVAEARAAVESAQKHLADGTAKEADVEAAKAAVALAETVAAGARSRMADARKTVTAKESAAASLRATADKAAEEAARATRKLQLFDTAPASDSRSGAGAGAPKEDAAVRNSAAQNSTDATGEGDRRTAQRDGEANASPVARAARLVEAALQESSDAIREARRLKSDVDEYDRQVKSTSRRLDATGKNLEAAQQTVLDNTIHTRLSAVRAPSSGTVLSVASLASEVSEGETIIRIGRPDVLRVRFADYSGTWKNLRPGALLTASVQPALDQSKAPTIRFRPNVTQSDVARSDVAQSDVAQTGAGPTPLQPKIGSAASVSGGAKMAASDFGTITSSTSTSNKTMPVESVGVPIVARVRSVEAPRGIGQPAVLEAVIFNPRRSVATSRGMRMRRVFRPGMAILCSIDTPGNRRVINVPSAAVLRDSPNSDHGLIAVLAPAPAPLSTVPAPSSTASSGVPETGMSIPETPTVASDIAANASETLPEIMATLPKSPVADTLMAGTPVADVRRADDGSWHRIELRSVMLGRNDGVQQEIVSGLREGERIALQPVLLQTWSANFGSRAAVRVQPETERAPGL